MLLGRVAAPFGIQGWIKIQPYTAEPSGLERYTALWLGEGEPFRRHEVEHIAAHGRSVLCKLKGVVTRHLTHTEPLIKETAEWAHARLA